ncbi:MAG: FKBP-type peptidyl-prolyl cis-trans isomerase [Dysgonamonadaceae bacterium]|jgi:FKBP-type peptidyl-prolyl cis-trans isomerase SlyD|nr:FKBP-type peptidyl-prolyl cis-trans isomerase [Dysgonamonadaceae bacterium]
MKISDEKMVSLTYDLTVDEDGQKELMEKATRERPLTFMFGMGMMLEAFEKNIAGLEVNDKFSFTLSPEEAYGEYIEQHVVELPKKIFEIDGKFDSEKVAEGQTLPMMDASGHRMMGSVLEVKTEVVVMDFNHPLAGESLHFEGEVIDVHEPTPEEIAALTQSGGCDCESCEGPQDEEGCHCGCQDNK